MTTLREALWDAGLVTVQPMPDEADLLPQRTPQYIRDAAQIEVDDAIDRGRRFYIGFDLWNPDEYAACLYMLREWEQYDRRLGAYAHR